jgi:hypothetical protein
MSLPAGCWAPPVGASLDGSLGDWQRDPHLPDRNFDYARTRSQELKRCDTRCMEGIEYSVTIDARASTEDLKRLRAVVDEVAEIPRAVRAGAPVTPRATRQDSAAALPDTVSS